MPVTDSVVKTALDTRIRMLEEDMADLDRQRLMLRVILEAHKEFRKRLLAGKLSPDEKSKLYLDVMKSIQKH